MTPAEANDGELFVQSCGGVFPEKQRTPTTCLLISFVGLGGQWMEAEGWMVFYLKAQTIDSTDFVLDRDACSEENGGTN